MHNHDLLADLPAPHDDEPPSLRSDIVDELADHLHCAFRREVLKDGDETAAEERVLDRFGDPRKLARRLWWQAMWSRIMGKRILAGLQWVLTLAAVIMAAAVFWQQSQILTEMNAARQAETSWYQNLSTQLNDLRTRLPAQPQTMIPVGGGGDVMSSAGTASIPGMSPGLAGSMDDSALLAPGEPPGAKTSRELSSNVKAAPQKKPKSPVTTLTVKLVQSTDVGPPVIAQSVVLKGAGKTVAGQSEAEAVTVDVRKGLAEEQAVVQRLTGIYQFPAIKPNHYYDLEIQLADGQQSKQSLISRDGKPLEVTVICPAPRKKIPVTIKGPPLPADFLRHQDIELFAEFEQVSENYEGNRWDPAEKHLVFAVFDPQTGFLRRTSYNDPKINLGDVSFDERVVLVPTGRYMLRYFLAKTTWEPNLARIGLAERPLLPDDAEDYIAKPGENAWVIKIEDDFWAAARKKLSEVLAPGDSPGAEGLPGDNPPGDSPAAKTPTAQSRITILAHARGEPLRDVQVTLFGYKADKESASTQPTELASVTTKDSGTVEFDELMAGDYQVNIQSPQYGMRTYLGYELSGTDHQEQTVAVPTDVAATELKILPSNLPDDLIQANVRLGVRLNSEALKRDDLHWFANHDPYIAWVIGAQGIEGQLQLPRKVGGKAFHDAFFTQRHPYQPVTESTLKVMATNMHSYEWGLICPAPADGPTDAAQPAAAEWMVCASPPEKKGPGRSEPVPMMLNFQPAKDQPNVWRIEIPEGMIAQARAKVRAAKGNVESVTP